MTTALQICVNFSACKFGSLHGDSQRKPINFGVKFTAFRQENSFKLRVCKVGERYSLFGGEKRDGFLVTSDKKRKRVVLVRFNQGFGFNGGGGGGGGGKNDGTTARVLGNLALAIGLTYLSMTGQLGWLLDAIVSIWVLLFLSLLSLSLRVEIVWLSNSEV